MHMPPRRSRTIDPLTYEALRDQAGAAVALDRLRDAMGSKGTLYLTAFDEEWRTKPGFGVYVDDIHIGIPGVPQGQYVGGYGVNEEAAIKNYLDKLLDPSTAVSSSQARILIGSNSSGTLPAHTTIEMVRPKLRGGDNVVPLFSSLRT